MDIQQEANQDKISRYILKFTDALISISLLIGLVILLVYMAIYLKDLSFEVLNSSRRASVVHDIVFLVVLVKAYRLLVYYFRTQHVSIKYIIEISIIAPSIEIIFSAANHGLWLNVIFGVYSIVNLIIYVFYYEELKDISLQNKRLRKQALAKQP